MAEIALLPAASSEDAVLVAKVCELVNSAYVLAEQGMWHAGVARTTVAETAEAISRGELVAAWGHGQLVGAIRSRQLTRGQAGLARLPSTSPTVDRASVRNL